MSDYQREKRKHDRCQSSGLFRIYTSVTSCAYTVNIKDISKSGAFINTPHMPEIGETITYVIVDEWGREQFIGNAKVKWLKTIGSEMNRGFGIQFEKQILEEIHQFLKENKKDT